MAGSAPPRFAAETARDAGLDVRYPLSGALTLDLTVNTDFAQVEADDQQINLDRFPLFFPERRRFFHEGSGLLDFSAGNGTRLFHSRRIGTALNARASGNAILQYNSTTDRFDANLRLRYAFSEGTDLWLVYNEGLLTERTENAGEPLLPRSMSHSVVLKYSRTLAF